MEPVFSTEYLAELLALPEVEAARANLSPENEKVQFTIPVTETIRSALLSLGLDIATWGIQEIPMRWIQGDTSPHVDSGPSAFENTYLVYLTDSPGEFVLGETIHPIAANTAFVFNEGVQHETRSTGTVPRLLLGPMNEFGHAVGGPPVIIEYYSNYADAVANFPGDLLGYSVSYIIGDLSSGGTGNIGTTTSWRIARMGYASNSPPSTVYSNTTDVSSSGLDFPLFVYPASEPTPNIWYYSDYILAFSHSIGNEIAYSFSKTVGDIVAGGNIGSTTSWRIAYMGDGYTSPPSTVYSNGTNLTSSGLAFQLHLYPDTAPIPNIFYYSDYAQALAHIGGTQDAYNDGKTIGAITNGNIGSTTSWRIAYMGDGSTSPPSTVYNNGTDLTSSGLSFAIYVYPESVPIPNIWYYSNYAQALAHIGGTQIAYNDGKTIGGVTSGTIGATTSWRIAYMGDGSTSAPSTVYSNGTDLTSSSLAFAIYVYPATTTPPNPCFMEGTTVLCYRDGVEAYVPIETLTRGTSVLTPEGYKKVELMGRGTINNRGDTERVQDRLYRCPVSNYPQLTDDLYITGCHSILVPNLSDKQRRKIEEAHNRVFITGNKYRLMAYVDERAEPWASAETYTIWHLALENKNVTENYGIYVNGGLLVETCCIQRMRGSKLTLL